MVSFFAQIFSSTSSRGRPRPHVPHPTRPRRTPRPPLPAAGRRAKGTIRAPTKFDDDAGFNDADLQRALKASVDFSQLQLA